MNLLCVAHDVYPTKEIIRMVMQAFHAREATCFVNDMVEGNGMMGNCMQALSKTVREAAAAVANGSSVQQDALRAAAPQVHRGMQQGLYGHGAALQRPLDVALWT